MSWGFSPTEPVQDINLLILVSAYVMFIEVDVTRLSDSLYSYQHLKAFGNANHLYLDPWNTDTVWLVNSSWTIQKATMEACTFLVLIFNMYT